MKKDLSTEAKIIEAATQVFRAKGFSGCSSREIAKASGMNVALVNYYFRSKGQLFQLIFKTAMEDFIESMICAFSSEKSLEDKMRVVIEKEYEFLLTHPELPAFIINEMNRAEGCSLDHASFFEKIRSTGVFEQCVVAQAEGRMRQIDLLSVTLLIMSNCQYPVMAKNLLQGIHSISEEQYSENLELHKKHVTEMLISYLFPTQTKNDLNKK